MNYLCKHKLPGNHPFCGTDHPVDAPCGAFEYVRVERPEDLPAADPKRIDVAVLDMNHGWPNLGHDCLVHAVLDAACALLPVARETGIRVRALSFDVRGHGMIPDPASGRFALYLGTGGPGHIDPAANDGVSEGSQGIREDPSWQQPLYRLFDHILADENSALLAVCHTFGVLCDWSGLAVPVLRGLEKGGKSTGVLENVLSPEACDHPWFRRCHEEMGGRLRVLDNRLFDLIPREGTFPDGVTAIGWETLGVGGPPGDAITMIEFARDAGGVMPRVFGVNHHPEIANRAGQLRHPRAEARARRGERDLVRGAPGGAHPQLPGRGLGAPPPAHLGLHPAAAVALPPPPPGAAAGRVAGRRGRPARGRRDGVAAARGRRAPPARARSDRRERHELETPVETPRS